MSEFGSNFMLDRLASLGGAKKQEMAQKTQSKSMELLEAFETQRGQLEAQSSERIARGSASVNRSAGQAVADTGRSLGAGLSDGVLGIVAFGTGMVDPQAGQDLANFSNRFSEGIRDGRSSTARAADDVYEIDQNRARTQRQAEYVEGMQGYEGNPGRDRFFSEITDTASNLWSNPTAALSKIADGVGSLGVDLGAGAATGWVATLANSGRRARATYRQMRADGATENVSRAAAENIRRGEIRRAVAKTMPAIAGTQEAAGTYTGIAEEVGNMTHEALMEGSQYYRSLIEQNMDPEDAKTMVAHRAGMHAAAIQGPAAATINRLFTAGFEASLVTRGPIGQAARGGNRAKNAVTEVAQGVAREGAEELVQGISGSVSTGIGIKASADESRDVTEGAGVAAVEGTIAGMGAGAVVSTPRAASELVGSGVEVRQDQIERSRDKDLKTNKDKTVAAASDLGQQSAAIVERLESAPETPTATEAPTEASAPVEGETAASEQAPTNAPDIANVSNTLRAVYEVGKAEFSALPKAVQKTFWDEGTPFEEGTAVDRVAVFDEVLTERKSEQFNDNDKATMTLWLAEQAQQLEALRDLDTTGMDPDVIEMVDKLAASRDTIQSNRDVVEALEAAKSIDSKDLGEAPAVTAENVGSDAVQSRFTQEQWISKNNPAGVDPSFIKSVLNQKTPSISAQVRARMMASAELAESSQRYTAEMQRMKAETDALLKNKGKARTSEFKDRNIVNNEIMKEGKDGLYDQPGLSEHQARVNTFMDQNNTKAAQDQLDKLGGLVDHMTNKLAAGLESYNLGQGDQGKVKFDTWNGFRMVKSDAEGASDIWVIKNSPTSVELAKIVGLEAQLLAEAYNNMLKQYGQFGLTGTPKKIEVPSVFQVGSKPESEQVTDDSKSSDTVRKAADQETKKTPEVKEAQESGTEPKGEEQRSTQSDQTAGETVDQSDGDAGRDGETARVVEPEGPQVEKTTTDSTGLNRFVRSFTFPGGKSKLLTQAQTPIRSVVDLIKNFGKDLKDLKDMRYVWTDERKKILQELAEDTGVGLAQEMNHRLMNAHDKKYSSTEGPAPYKKYLRAKKDPRILGYPEARNLNLVVERDGGKRIEYEPRILGATVLAVLDWVSSNNVSQQPMSKEDIAKSFHIDEGEVSSTLQEALIKGMNWETAINNVTDHILDFWGVDLAKDAPMTDTRGIAMAMAIEAMELLNQNRWATDTGKGRTQRKHIHIMDTDLGDGRKPRVLQLHKISPKSTALAEVGVARGFIGEVLLGVTQPTRHIGKPPETTAHKQKGNPLGALNAWIQKAMKNQQETPLKQNVAVVHVMTAIGQEAWQELVGYSNYDPEMTNKNTAATLEGQNTSMRNSWERLFEHIEEMLHVAERDGVEIENLDTFNEYFASINDRMFAKGFNGQANKWMRHAFSPTVATLNITSKKGHDQFWHTIAQAVGVKTEKVFRNRGITEAKGLIESKYRKSVAHLEDTLRTGEPLSAEAIADMKSELDGKPMEAALMDGLTGVALYNMALDPENPIGDAKKFQHFVPLEADGKTDGPIHAMMHFVTGEFRERWVNSVAKGGVFFNSGRKSLNTHLSRKGMKDIYETVADRASVISKSFRNSLPKEKQMQAHMEATLRMTSILEDFHFDGESITFKRGAAKNPTTVVIYGAGANSIGLTLADAIMEEVYAIATEVLKDQGKPDGFSNMTEYMQVVRGYPGDFVADLRMVTQNTLVVPSDKTKEPYIWNKVRVGKGKDKENVKIPFLNLSDLKKFTASNLNMMALGQTMKNHYVNPMLSAIEYETDKAMNSLKKVQKATDVMSIIFMDRFEKAVYETLAEKRDKKTKDGVAKDPKDVLGNQEFLSQEDYNTVFKKVSKFAAVIESVAGDPDTAKHLHVSGKESGISDHKFASSQMNTLIVNGRLAQPSRAGVRIMPAMTISRGDAETMVRFFAEGGSTTRALQVFDGLYMPADAVKEISEAVNKTSWETWMTNPLQDAADSYDDFLRSADDALLRQVSFDVIESLVEAFDIDVQSLMAMDPNTDIVVAIVNEMRELKETLTKNAISAQARKEVMAEMDISVDHFASGGAPFVSKGSKGRIKVKNTKELITEMNKRYEEKKAAIEKKLDMETPKSSVEPDQGWMTAAVAEKGIEVGEGVQEVPAHALTNAVMRNGTEDQKRIMEQLRDYMSSLQFGHEMSILVGDKDALNQWRDERYPKEDGTARRPEESIDRGMTDFGNKIVYIASQSGETVLHEMLHAVLGSTLHLHDMDPEKATTLQKNAIKNLRAMQAQFMEMSFAADGAETSKAAMTAQDAIREAQNMGSEADATLEFISWTLTNQGIARSLKKSKLRVKLEKLIGDSLRGLKRLLGIPHNQQLDMFSNIEWNTQALMRESAFSTSAVYSPNVVLHQVTPNSDGRLENLARSLDNRITKNLTLDSTIKNENMYLTSHVNTMNNLIQRGGFTLNEQQFSVFRTLHSILESSIQVKPALVTRGNQLFQHFVKSVKVEDLMSDPKSNDPAVRDLAQSKLNTLNGELGTLPGKKKRSTLLANFLALGVVDPDVRRAVETVGLPPKLKMSFKTVDEAFTSTNDALINHMSRKVITGEDKTSSFAQVLDNLALDIGSIEKDSHSVIERETGRFLNKISDGLRNQIDNLSEKLESIEIKANEETDSAIADGIAGSASLARALINEKHGKNYAVTVGRMMNNMENQESTYKREVLALLRDIMGMNDETAATFMLVDKAKAKVQRMRQQFRTELPKQFNKFFKKEITKKDWQDLYRALGKTDLAVLVKTHSPNYIRQILGDSKALKKEMNAERETLRGLTPKLYNTYMTKIMETAKWMALGEVDPGNFMLNSNAMQISRLFGTNQTLSVDADPKVLESIERLLALTAADIVSENTPHKMDTLRKIIKEDQEGFEALLGYMEFTRLKENAKTASRDAYINSQQGYIPTESHKGRRLIVADDSKQRELERLGWSRVRDYNAGGLESGSQGLYFTAVGEKAIYSQGVLQTVQKSINGVDPRTGRSLQDDSGGMVDSKITDRIQSDISKGRTKHGKDVLVPLFNTRGDVIGFRRHLNPDDLKALNLNEQLDEMIGAWRGRQEEESIAQGVNKELILTLKQRWDKGKKEKRTGEFIRLDDPKMKNEIWADTWKTIPIDTKEMVKEIFGEDGFMVNTDSINNAVGYRGFTIGEAYTGPTELNDQVKQTIEGISTLILGKNAYKHLKKAEQNLQSAVSVAKSTIVIRSIVIPVANFSSNVIQLLSYGLTPRQIYQGYKEKLVEVETYIKANQRLMQIEAETTAFSKDPRVAKRLEAETQSLLDTIKGLSLAPLLEAGMFSSISEGMAEIDSSIVKAEWADKLEAALDNIPQKLGTVGRYTAMTQDSEIFKLLARATMYGDFLGKSILYDHQVKANKKTPQQALRHASEAFVNYNFMAGRMYSYANASGLLWFWAYKIRSIKEAHRMIRDNPLKALTSSLALPEILDGEFGIPTGSPVSDNAITAILQDRAKYSVGLPMLFRAPYMHLIGSLFD